MKFKLTAMAVAAALSAGTAMVAQAATPDSFPAPAADRTTWYTAGANKVISNAAIVNKNNLAKNVILFVGDGMGISTITAARILAGQQPNIIGSNAPANQQV